MRVKNKKRYIEWKKKNEDEYGKEVFEFAERWADLMEIVRAAGRKIENVYEELSDAANVNGITGAMYYIALKMLVENWIYGDELKQAIIKNGATGIILKSNLGTKNNNYEIDALKSTVESVLMSGKELEVYILSDKRIKINMLIYNILLQFIENGRSLRYGNINKF